MTLGRPFVFLPIALSVLASGACSAPAADEAAAASENVESASAALTDPPRIYALSRVAADNVSISTTLSTTAPRTTDCKKLVLRAYIARSGECGAGQETPVLLTERNVSFGANETKQPRALGTKEIEERNTSAGVKDHVFCGVEQNLLEQDCGYRCIYQDKEYTYGTEIESKAINTNGHKTITCEPSGEITSDVYCAVIDGVKQRPTMTWTTPGTNGQIPLTCLGDGTIHRGPISCIPGHSPRSAEACDPSPCDGSHGHDALVINTMPWGEEVKTCRFGGWVTENRCNDAHKLSNGTCIPKASCGSNGHGTTWWEWECAGSRQQHVQYRCDDGRPRVASAGPLAGRCQ